MRNMKHISNFGLALVALVGILSSCNKEDGKITGFNVDKEEITVGAEGGEELLNISSASEWVALASEPWVTISPANGVGAAQCSIRIDSTLVNDVRKATVRFSPNGEPAKLITVNQIGYGKMISLNKEEVEVENSALYNKRYFELSVTTNVEFDIEIENSGKYDWLSPAKYAVELDRGSRPRTVKIRFDWKMNPDPEERSVKVKFVPKDASVKLEKPAELMVMQKPAPKIEDNRAGDSLALITIAEKLQASGWDTSENMKHWNSVELWDDGDEGLPCPEAVGRVRYAKFFVFSTKESIPQEVKYLKYAETLSFFGNTNTMYLNIALGNEICELRHLKNLQIAAYGIASLPDEFKNMKQLEVLDINSNNFPTIPAILTPENFPNLKELNLMGMRRWLTTDLRNAGNSRFENGLGFHLNMADEEAQKEIKRLFRWEKLEYLALTYNYLEGHIPDFKVGEDGVTGYTEEDAVRMGLRDTIKFLYDPTFATPAGAPKGTTIPKILPNIKSLRLNLNFFTGKIPDWILYHPHFMDWTPDTFIFSQQDRGIDSKGNMVGFSNVPVDFEYYYAAFPAYRTKYYIKEEETED